MITDIHPTALVDSGAQLSEGCSVGAYTIIGPNVKIGKGTIVGPHVVIEGHTTIGDENHIFQFASVGSRPQDLKYRGEPSELRIGNKNLIREFTTLQPGTEGGGMVTSIGDGNLFMANSHVGHDCKVGSNNVFANSVALAGHVEVGDRAILGGLSAIHQFVRVGDLSLVAGGAMVPKDIPPFCIVQGDRAEVVGINLIGLKRAKFSEDEISWVKKAYRTYFFMKANSAKDQAIEAMQGKSEKSDFFLNFISSSSRGVCRLRKKSTEESEEI